MRLIDADALVNEFLNVCRTEFEIKNKCMADENVLHLIHNAPTVKPQKIVTIPPELIEKLASCVVDIVGNIDWEKAIEAYKARPQGEWLEDSGNIACSYCHTIWLYRRTDFCPHCGADMRGGRE